MATKAVFFSLALTASCAVAVTAWAETTAVQPDLDGDGKGDTVQVVAWEGPPVIAVQLSASGTVLTLMHLDSAKPRPDLHVAAPGVYKGMAGEVTLKTDGLIAAFPEASSVLLYLEDGKPRELPLSD